MSKSWCDVLVLHPAAELLPLMSRDDLKALGEDIKKNELTSPIVIWSERGRDDEPHYLLDGRNRLDAMELVGIPVLNEKGDLCVPLVKVSDLDPYAYFLSANVHRRHLTGEQKRELIAKVLKAQPESSNRQIAELTNVSHHTVESVREGMEARGQIAHVETRQDSKGRQQPARKPLPSALDKGHVHRKSVVPELTSLSWSEASPEVRRKFVANVGLPALYNAAEPYLQSAFVAELDRDSKSATAYAAAHPGR
jgi:hypothetical protein